MKIKLMVAISLILLFLLTGCSNSEIEEKIDTNRYYTYMQIYNGKSFIIIPVWHEEVKDEQG